MKIVFFVVWWDITGLKIFAGLFDKMFLNEDWLSKFLLDLHFNLWLDKCGEWKQFLKRNILYLTLLQSLNPSPDASGQRKIFWKISKDCDVTLEAKFSSETMILDNDLFPLVLILGPITQLKFSQNNSNCKIAT